MKFFLYLILLCVCSRVSAQTRTIRLPDIERRETRIFPSVVPAQQQDPQLMALGNPQTRNQAIAQYQAQGATAVPELMTHLQNRNQGIRLLALSALQYAWAPQAEAAVLPFLKSRDDMEAKSAWFLLKQKMDHDDLNQWAEQDLLQLNPWVLGMVLQRLEREGPNPTRMLYVLNQPRFWKPALELLPRYHAKEFQQVTRYISLQAEGEWLAHTIAAMIHQRDRDPATLKQMEAFLKNEDGRVREMAAEYFRWHGSKSALPVLEDALQAERDPFTYSSLQEAVRILTVREEGEVPPGPQPMEPLVNYAEGISSEMGEGVQERMDALRAATGYAESAARGMEEEPVWRIVPPTRSFLDGGGNYAVQSDAVDGPFADSVHVARDVSWGEEMATVVAIAPGVVKRVQIARESWGGLVVMEHEAPNGRTFCSLYGHLGPLITVKAGDKVAAGTKLGSLGRSYTAENGGYRSHLHFGVYDASYGWGRWVTGYMDPEKFVEGEHNWIDPYALYGLEPERTGHRH